MSSAGEGEAEWGMRPRAGPGATPEVGPWVTPKAGPQGRPMGARGRVRECRGAWRGVRARVGRVTFSECAPLWGVVGSWTAASGPLTPSGVPLVRSGVRLTPLAISIKICSYHLIKNIPFMI